MKIRKNELMDMIHEELNQVLSEVNRQESTQRQRDLPWEAFPGYDDKDGGLKQLALGIMEDDDDLEEDCAGNPHHSRSGHWTDPEKESGSWSKSGPTCDKTGQRKRPRGRHAVAISPSLRPCGRAGRFRCKDGTAKYGPGAVPPTNEVLITDDEEQGIAGADRAYIVGLIQQTMKQIQSEKGQAQTGCSIDYCLKVLNAMARAGEGHLNDPPKPTG